MKGHVVAATERLEMDDRVLVDVDDGIVVEVDVSVVGEKDEEELFGAFEKILIRVEVSNKVLLPAACKPDFFR